MTNKSARKKSLFCNRCGVETNHICKAEYFKDYPTYAEEGQLIIVERMGYRFWICAGCDTATLEEFYIFDITNETEAANPALTYYPERARLHVKGKKFQRLPSKLKTIYEETLRAFNNRLYILSSLGIRSLLEGICSDKGISGANLQDKIDNMKSIITQNIVTNLHSLRFIGNNAAHELKVPGEDELRLAIEICEDLLNYLYDLDYKARKLGMAYSASKKQRIPKVTTQS